MPSDNISTAMPVVAALQVLIAERKSDHIVVTNQGSARVWPKLNQHALDLHYNPSTMGGAVPLGLGFAIAQPQREVLIVSGDGSLLMSLGSLVTVVGSGLPPSQTRAVGIPARPSSNSVSAPRPRSTRDIDLISLPPGRRS